MVPSVFEMCTTETIAVDSSISSRAWSMSRVPSSSTRMYRTSAPVRLLICCHVTSDAWCSISVRTTESSGPNSDKPHAYATRFIASVVFFVKTTSSLPAAPMNSATRSWARSYATDASWLRWWIPRWTFEL